jgi:hypothetical protein
MIMGPIPKKPSLPALDRPLNVAWAAVRFLSQSLWGARQVSLPVSGKPEIGSG